MEEETEGERVEIKGERYQGRGEIGEFVPPSISPLAGAGGTGSKNPLFNWKLLSIQALEPVSQNPPPPLNLFLKVTLTLSNPSLQGSCFGIKKG